MPRQLESNFKLLLKLQWCVSTASDVLDMPSVSRTMEDRWDLVNKYKIIYATRRRFI